MMNYIQVTIVAGSSDAWIGLPGVSRDGRRAQMRLSLGESELISIPSGYEWQQLPWANRGWTLQEGCLSRRRIIFCEEQVLYLCEQMFCLEGIAQIPPPWQSCYKAINNDTIRKYIPSIYDRDIWGLSYNPVGMARDILTSYCPRVLSFSQDALNACLGLLNVSEVTHFWGVPIGQDGQNEAYRGMDLCWVNERSRRERHEFPSWSWVRWTGHKRFTRISNLKVEIHLDTTGWADVSHPELPRGNVGEWSSTKALRVTGMMLQPQFTRHNGQVYATLRTSQGFEIHLETILDSEDISSGDLGDAVLMVYDDIRKRTHGDNTDGNQRWTELRGRALILIPYQDSYRRLGVAGWTGYEYDDIICSNKEELGEGVLEFADALRCTILLE